MLEKTNRNFFWKLVVPKPRGGLVQGCQKKNWNLTTLAEKTLEFTTKITKTPGN